LWVLLKDAASLPVKEVLEDFKTTNKGLTSEEAAKRLAEHGPNMLVEKKQVPITYKFLAIIIMLAEEARKWFARRTGK